MSKKAQPKEPQVSFEIPVTSDLGLDGIRIDRDLGVSFLDAEGKEVVVRDVTRSVEHARTKGSKVRSRQLLSGSRLSLDALDELCAFHDVFVIDTAFSYYPLRRARAVACALRVRFRHEKSSVAVLTDDHLIVYDLLDFEGNPERAAVLALTHDHSQSLGDRALRRGVVNDSDLGQHGAINSRQTAIYGSVKLADAFTLMYASADTGQETFNRILRFCDGQARWHLAALISGDAPTPDRYEQIPGAGRLRVGKLRRMGVESSNAIITRARGVEYATLVFHGEDGRTETTRITFGADHEGGSTPS